MGFGVWKQFMTTPEGDDVVVVPDPMVERESSQNQVIVNKEWRGLRYDLLNLSMFQNLHPTPFMKVFLWEHMDFGRMIDKVMMVWEMLAERKDEEESKSCN